MYGALVLPRKRLDYASFPMLFVGLIVTGIPMMGLVFPVPRSMFGSRSRFFEVLMWVAAVLLPICALWNMKAYQLRLRDESPHGDEFGKFEVRWR